MSDLRLISFRYNILYSFFRSKACYEVLKDYLDLLDSNVTHPFTHIQNLLIQDVFLSWCKVFGTNMEECHWKCLINDHEDFKKELYFEITEKEFSDYWSSVIEFRNKWVVHSDPKHKQNPVPYLDIAEKSARYLFDYITRTYRDEFTYDGPKSLDIFIGQIKCDFRKKLKI